MRAGGHKERKNLKTRPLGEGKSQFCYVVCFSCIDNKRHSLIKIDSYFTALY